MVWSIFALEEYMYTAYTNFFRQILSSTICISFNAPYKSFSLHADMFNTCLSARKKTEQNRSLPTYATRMGRTIHIIWVCFVVYLVACCPVPILGTCFTGARVHFVCESNYLF